MSTNRDFDRIASGWLAEGPTELNDRVLEAALDEVHLTHQRRRPAVPWRTPFMTTPMRLAAAIAIVAVVGFAGLTFIQGGLNIGRPAPTPSCTSAVAPSLAPSPGASPIDRGTWTTYVSQRYGFSICRPADWVVHPGDHDWTFAADAADTLSPPQFTAYERFASADDSIEISAWSVAVTPGTTVAGWLQAYCPIAESNAPCAAIQDGALTVAMDGHAGSIVPFVDDVQAFFLIDNRIYVVASWRPAAEYDSLQLLEAFVSTMHLLPGGPIPGATSAPPA